MKSGEETEVILPYSTTTNKTELDFGTKYSISRANVTAITETATRTFSSVVGAGDNYLLKADPAVTYSGSTATINYGVNPNPSHTNEREQSYQVEFEFTGIADKFTYVENIVQPKATYADEFTMSVGSSKVTNGGSYKLNVASGSLLSDVYSQLSFAVKDSSEGIPNKVETDVSGGTLSSATIVDNYLVSKLDFGSNTSIGDKITVEYTLTFSDDSTLTYSVEYIVASVTHPTLALTGGNNSYSLTYDSSNNNGYNCFNISGIADKYQITSTTSFNTKVYDVTDTPTVTLDDSNNLVVPNNTGVTKNLGTLYFTVNTDSYVATYKIPISQNNVTMAENSQAYTGTEGVNYVGYAKDYSGATEESVVKNVVETYKIRPIDTSFDWGVSSMTMNGTSLTTSTSNDPKYVEAATTLSLISSSAKEYKTTQTITVTFSDASTYSFTRTFRYKLSDRVASVKGIYEGHKDAWSDDLASASTIYFYNVGSIEFDIFYGASILFDDEDITGDDIATVQRNLVEGTESFSFTNPDSETTFSKSDVFGTTEYLYYYEAGGDIRSQANLWNIQSAALSTGIVFTFKMTITFDDGSTYICYAKGVTK